LTKENSLDNLFGDIGGTGDNSRNLLALILGRGVEELFSFAALH
jgi:hypothetical protein